MAQETWRAVQANVVGFVQRYGRTVLECDRCESEVFWTRHKDMESMGERDSE